MPRISIWINEPNLINGQTITIYGDEAHYLAHVMRSKRGDRVIALNGQGWVASGIIQSIHAKEASLSIEKVVIHPKPRVELTLVQAIPKNRLLEDIVRHAIEIGVSTIIPVYTTRTINQLKQPLAEHRYNRLQSIAVEACKQSGNPFLPAIHQPENIDDFLTKIPPPSSSRFYAVASLQTQQLLVDEQQKIKAAQQIVYLVGPEGDFTDEEYRSISEAGFCPIRLGCHILRCETAAIYGLSALDALMAHANHTK